MATKTIKGKFNPSPTAEREFMRALKKVARVSGHIVESHVNGVSLRDQAQMQKALKDYSNLIEPWAQRQVLKLLEQVQKSNKRAYQQKTKTIGMVLRNVGDDEVGERARLLMMEQVGLIKSIPIEAGARAQELALKAAFEGTRARPDQTTI